MNVLFKKKILITTGDPDGIGPEVTYKALSKIAKLHRDVQFFVFSSVKKSKYEGLLKKKIISQNINFDSAVQINLIKSKASCTKWVETAGEFLMLKKAEALVTGPLSKPQIIKDGFYDIGHTDVLKRVSGEKSVFMTFLGKKFNVLLLTGHIPLSQVEIQLTEKELRSAFEKTVALMKKLHLKGKIGVLGLNPHAGDKGLIGQFDDKKLRAWINKLSKNALAEGPLVPDAALTPANRKKYQFYFAQYHDQGLIPFKALHGIESGVHLSLGLPFVRTSVDHGTAKDIFDRGLANPGSMIEAINLAIRIS